MKNYINNKLNNYGNYFDNLDDMGKMLEIITIMGQTLCLGAAIVFALPPDRAERFTSIIVVLCGSVVFYVLRKAGRLAYKKDSKTKEN